jgi:hypothetical protein
MQDQSNPPLPSDVCLLLRADAEQSWLHREVIPVLRQVEARQRLGEEEEEVGAALAYLEAMWDEACVKARATDAASGERGPTGEQGEGLSASAGRDHAAVRALREVVAARVAPFVRGEEDLSCDGVADSLLAVDAALGPGGCAPRAA